MRGVGGIEEIKLWRNRFTLMLLGLYLVTAHGLCGDPVPGTAVPVPGCNFEEESETWEGGGVLDQTLFHSGKTSVRLSCDSNRTNVMIRSAPLKLEPLSRYRLTFWIHKDPALMCQFSVRDDRGAASLKNPRTVIQIPRPVLDGFEKFEGEFGTYSDCKAMELWLQAWISGAKPSEAKRSVWVDDVSLEYMGKLLKSESPGQVLYLNEMESFDEKGMPTEFSATYRGADTTITQLSDASKAYSGSSCVHVKGNVWLCSSGGNMKSWHAYEVSVRVRGAGPVGLAVFMSGPGKNRMVREIAIGKTATSEWTQLSGELVTDYGTVYTLMVTTGESSDLYLDDFCVKEK